jgi:hypothetical protein
MFSCLFPYFLIMLSIAALFILCSPSRSPCDESLSVQQTDLRWMINLLPLPYFPVTFLGQARKVTQKKGTRETFLTARPAVLGTERSLSISLTLRATVLT